MSLQQATPGPWTHNEGNPTRIIGADDETVAVLYGGAVGIGRQFENAALVAATPALYAYISERASGGDGDAQLRSPTHWKGTAPYPDRGSTTTSIPARSSTPRRKPSRRCSAG